MMRTLRIVALIAVVGAMLSPPIWRAIARDFQAGDLVLQNPWARATPSGAKVGGGYVTIVNKGSSADRLIGGSLDRAGQVEFHETAMQGAVATMRRLDSVVIPAGSSVAFAPLGKHIMFKDLSRGLTKGERISGTLVFEKAGTVPVQYQVEALGAQGSTDSQ
jgi:periplasmic copper chaperone A